MRFVCGQGYGKEGTPIFTTWFPALARVIVTNRHKYFTSVLKPSLAYRSSEGSYRELQPHETFEPQKNRGVTRTSDTEPPHKKLPNLTSLP